MPTPIDTVTQFFALAGRPGGLAQAIRDYFTPDAVWENVGLCKSTGPEEAVKLLAGFGMDAATCVLRVDMLAVAADADKVLTERIDYVLDGQGQTTMTVQVMGIFGVKDGKITAWRDYFDTAGLAAAASAAQA